MKIPKDINKRRALAEQLLPHFRDAVRANVEKWDAERKIELTLGADLDDRLYDSYVNICVACDKPADADKLVTVTAVLECLEAME